MNVNYSKNSRSRSTRPNNEKSPRWFNNGSMGSPKSTREEGV